MRNPPEQGGLRKYVHEPTVGLNATVTLAPTSSDDVPVIDAVYGIPSSSTNSNATLEVASTGSTNAWVAGLGQRAEQFSFPEGLYIGKNLSMVVTLTLGSTLDTAKLAVLGR